LRRCRKVAALPTHPRPLPFREGGEGDVTLEQGGVHLVLPVPGRIERRWDPSTILRMVPLAVPEGIKRCLAKGIGRGHVGGMLNIVSILIGIVALILGVLAFFPFLGWAYWLIVPLALVGVGLGQLSSSRGGRNLNLIVVVIGVVRLFMGGGIV